MYVKHLKQIQAFSVAPVGVTFLTAIIADLADPQPLADELDELVGPLGLAP